MAKVWQRNKASWVLFICVVVIWGTVVWKLLSFSSSPEPERLPHSSSVVSDNEEDRHLLLDYRDPFLGILPVRSVPLPRSPKKASSKKVDTLLPPVFRPKGWVRQGKRDFLIVDSAGAYQLISLPGVINGFLLRMISRDSVVATKKGQEFFFSINP